MKNHRVFLQLSAVLALSLLLASCGGQASSDTTAADTTAADTTAAPVIEETREPSGVPDALDLGGETITVWCSAGAYKNICTELTGDILDDAIYNNTLKAQEKLNCRIEYHDANGADSHTDISTILLADDTTYDLYLPKQWNGGKLVMEGLYLN